MTKSTFTHAVTQINGCRKSGLFQAFSEFMLHRMKIPLHHKSDDKIRITFLERKTKFRQILNSDELVAELRRNQSYSVKSVRFERATPFPQQLEVIRNTDIFIGMHGAGLTHLLFLPNWATVFEMYAFIFFSITFLISFANNYSLVFLKKKFILYFYFLNFFHYFFFQCLNFFFLI